MDRERNIMKTVSRTLRTLATRRMRFTFDKVPFSYGGMSRTRVWNWFLAETCAVLKPSRVFAHPTLIQVEPSSVCNLRCPLCYVVTEKREAGFMKLGDFKGLIEEVCDYAQLLHLWGWGEPFLNRDIFPMIGFARDRGMRVITSTNGHFFEDEENVDLLIDSGLDVLIFALDGADEETYARYREKGDFHRALSGLRRLLRRRDERGVSHPLVNLRMVVSKENESQVTRMKDLAREVRADMLSLKTMIAHGDEERWQEMLPADHAYRRYEYDHKGMPIKKKNSCKRMWNHPAVLYDGTVIACDYFTGRELSLGNVFAADGSRFEEIWFGEAYRRLRTRYLKGDHSGLRCEGCSRNYRDADGFVSHAFSFREA
jgi:MoaA/NifB/PqqE/SkfB family radical SAM enzyme